MRQMSRPVERVTPRIKQLLDDMLETMRAADGVGLAAPQVGGAAPPCGRRGGGGPPDISYKSGRAVYESGEQEGSGGVPFHPLADRGIVRRPMKVTVRATGYDGKPLEITGEGLLARAFCHEIDHLDGKLYTDIAISMEDK